MKIKFIENVFDKESMIQRYTGDIVDLEDKRAKEIINANFAIQVEEEKGAQVKDIEDTKTKKIKKGDSNKKK